MLNFADLGRLLMIFFGPLMGFCAAFSHKAGWGTVTLFTVGGLLVGIGSGIAFTKLAYLALESKRLPEWLGIILYGLIPFLGVLTVALAPIVIAAIIIS
jgi:hypothetical protein